MKLAGNVAADAHAGGGGGSVGSCARVGRSVVSYGAGIGVGRVGSVAVAQVVDQVGEGHFGGKVGNKTSGLFLARECLISLGSLSLSYDLHQG